MLAVIPARGGSKGVPNKNIKEIAGKPLIAYTIQAALESGVFEKVIVSTDDKCIADVALQYGGEVPFIRPDAISGDEVSSDDVILHAIEYFKQQGIVFEDVCKLQPTSPLRTATHIKEAYAHFKNKNADYCVSVCECDHSPLWCNTLDEDSCMDDFLSEEVKRACRQDLPTYYRLNGAIYMGRVDSFCENKSFFGKNSFAYIMEQNASIDIDSYLDFDIAELYLKKKP